MIVLPGPPRELQPMWRRAIETEPVQEVLARATPLRGYTMRMFGVPESEIARSLLEIESDGDELGRGRDHHLPAARRDRDRRPLPRGGRGGGRGGQAGLIERHRPYLFSDGRETIDEIVAELLRGHRLGLAESCSGGQMASRITARPGASDYFAGSAVAYSNEAKVCCSASTRS